jgi:hypothetical protein
MYDARVFDIIAGLKLFERGEFEITDVNNENARAGEMTFDVLPGWWADAGTQASKLKASILAALAKGVDLSSVRSIISTVAGPHTASRTDATGPMGSPSTRVGSRSFLLGPNVMALRAKLALGHLAGPTTVQSLRSIRTRSRSMLQRDPDRSEGH